MRRYLIKFAYFTTLVIALLTFINMILPTNPNGYLFAQIDKMNYLNQSNRKPTVILLGGSNVAFGYDTENLNNTLNFPCYNAGLHAGLGMKFIFDDCAQHLKKGDILVLSPEYNHFYSDDFYGKLDLTNIFLKNPLHYIEHTSIEQFKSIIENFPLYLHNGIKSTINTNIFNEETNNLTYQRSSINKYGDASWHWYNKRDHKSPQGQGLKYDVESFNEKGFKYFINKIEELEAKGIKVVLYPPVYNEEAFKKSTKQVNYVAERFSDSGHAFICSPKEVAYPQKYFYDTDYHLNHEGAILHTEHITNILKPIINK